MAWARWAVVVLAAAAGAIFVLSASLDQLERTVWTLGLRHLLPQFNPPLGDTARMGLTALAALLAGLLGWGLLALLGIGGRRAPAEVAATAAVPAWRLPPADIRPAADPQPAASPPVPDDAATLPPPEALAAAEGPPVPAAMPEPTAPVEPDTPTVRAVDPPIALGSVAGAGPAGGPAPQVVTDPAPVTAVDPAPAQPPARPPASVVAPAEAGPLAPTPMDDAVRTAMLASLARIEAQLAEARQGPVVGPNAQLIARFEELDSRVTAQVAQIAQQLVEVAQLARSAARAPVAPPASVLSMAPALDAPRQLPARPARRPANRAELAAAIRGLRAALDAGPGLSGAA
jgi:hypothetical protein